MREARIISYELLLQMKGIFIDTHWERFYQRVARNG